ncbi:MAG TPA: Glu/Leu/Phe/Val dehydrogenase dimerization domain-containing protein [Gemmatimonadales bacterium]|nr:Glu/Leu/Phe/Val dehydrogenase dimerization domain-containing protein [Gemmatimonadales bacterium]
MDLLNEMAVNGHEQVVFGQDAAAGYRAIVAIHSTRLGPALGGTRFWPYATTDEALTDVLRLSRAMTYKAAVLGLGLGGGKAVIIGDNRRADREPLFRAHGRFIQSLGGRYITAEDIGTTPADMAFVRCETAHVAGLADRSGDPSPVTGFGVYMGMKAAAKRRWGSDRLAGRTVLVQGAGKVAVALCRHLHEEGARLVVTDIAADKVRRVVEEFAAEPVAPEAIYDQPGDVYAPCALGATINDDTLGRLRVGIIAGGANNQLAQDRHGAELEARGMLYAPDFVINGGGLVSVYGELKGWPESEAHRKAAEIYDTILRVFDLAEREGIPSFRAAERLAEAQLQSRGGSG